MKTPRCEKCKSEMEKGFIGDKADLDNEVRQSWGTGINALGTGMINAYPVTTYRCKKCGYLESYAL